jgi:hypothetical protein
MLKLFVSLLLLLLHLKYENNKQTAGKDLDVPDTTVICLDMITIVALGYVFLAQQQQQQKRYAIKIDYDNDKETIVTIIAPPLLCESRRRYIVPAGT